MIAAAVSAAPVMIKATLDSATMTMGYVSPLKVEVVKDRDAKGSMTLYEALAQSGRATLLGDTVEIAQLARPDTSDIGSGRVQIDYHLGVQVFDSGAYKLPPFVYSSGSDTARSKQLYIKIVPVKVTAEDKISPMTPVQEPQGKSIFDNLPDWLYYWWWVLPLLALLIFLFIWALRRYKKTGSILPPKAPTPPHILALDRLRRLKQRRLWEDGREKDYYSALTDILRAYLDGRFGIKALEMTSSQIKERLADDPTLRDSREKIRQVLDMADYVKFAKVRPLPDDNVKAYDNAVKFVEDTAPQPEPEAKDEKSPEGAAQKGGEA